MKRILISFLATVAFVVSVKAAVFEPVSFLNGNTVILSNNATVTFGDTAVAYIKPSRILQWSSSSNNIIPNAYDASGNRVDSQSPLAAAFYYTNSIGTNSGNAFAPFAWRDVNGSADRNGGLAIVNFSATFSGRNSTDALYGTNLVTFIVVKVPDSQNVSTSPADKLTFAQAIAAGTTAVSYSTNPPSGFTQGVGAYRLLSVAVNNVTNLNTIYLSNVTMNVFVP